MYMKEAALCVTNPSLLGWAERTVNKLEQARFALG